MTLRKRKFKAEETSTPRVKAKKQKTQKKQTPSRVKFNPPKQAVDSLKESLLFEDAVASPSPVVLEQNNFGLNVQESCVSLLVQGRSPNFEQPSDALQLRPSSLEQQHSAVDAAQPQLTHALQVPRRSPFALQAATLAFTQNSQVSRQNDAISNMSITETVAGHSAAATCRLPPIWRAQPKVWFCQVESVLEENNVIIDRSKYNLVVGALDSETLADVADLLLDPPATDRYLALKTRILERLSDTPERQLQKVFSEVQLEGRKPSQLFRHMRVLAGDSASESVIRARWLTLLPSHVQGILKIFKKESIDDLLATADQLMESPITPVVNAVGDGGLFNSSGSSALNLSEIKLLLSQLICLTRETIGRRSDDSVNNRRSRSRSPNNNHGRSSSTSRSFRGRPQSPLRASGLCFYHERFGSRAHRCSPPCSFESSSSRIHQGNAYGSHLCKQLGAA